jgi:hypothetical protein
VTTYGELVGRARCREPRLPFEPLEELVSGRCGLRTARTLGVDPRQVYRWRAGGLSWAKADELAVRIGLHPVDVWGAEWWEGVEP